MKYLSLRPLLESNDLPGTIQFYTTLLGFCLTGSYPKNEELQWCELQKDEVIIMFSRPNRVMQYPAVMLSGSLYINTDNVDAVWETIKDRCDIVYEPDNFEHEMREFGIRDNNGYVIIFGQPI